MKVTSEIAIAFLEAKNGSTRGPAQAYLDGLDAAFADVPDVEPFAFPGYPDNPVFLHPCGTVIDVVPGGDTEADVKDGACDCEGGQPWKRIYVEKD